MQCFYEPSMAEQGCLRESGIVTVQRLFICDIYRPVEIRRLSMLADIITGVMFSNYILVNGGKQNDGHHRIFRCVYK